MNKDFLSKPISLKDIDLKNIDWKNLKNKKEIVIGILILVYIIVIICIGNSLLNTRAEVEAEYLMKETKYNSLHSAGSEDALKEQIDGLEVEKALLANRIVEIDSNTELTKIFDDFKAGAPINWSEQEIVPRPETKELAAYNVYIANISKFSGSLSQIEDFLQYVETYEKLVRIDTLAFKKNEITGNFEGQLKLSFYFKKIAEE